MGGSQSRSDFATGGGPPGPPYYISIPALGGPDCARVFRRIAMKFCTYIAKIEEHRFLHGLMVDLAN